MNNFSNRPTAEVARQLVDGAQRYYAFYDAAQEGPERVRQEFFESVNLTAQRRSLYTPIWNLLTAVLDEVDWSGITDWLRGQDHFPDEEELDQFTYVSIEVMDSSVYEFVRSLPPYSDLGNELNVP